MSDSVVLAHLNIRSLLPKLNHLKEHISSANYTILCLTETWLSPTTLSDVIAVEGYALVRKDRRLGRGGGVGMYIKNSVSFNLIHTDDDIEQLWIKLKINKKQFAVGAAYKPPNFSHIDFINKLENTISSLLPEYDEIFCLGDFNIDLLKSDTPASNKLNSMIAALDLTQLVDAPTRNTPLSTSLIDVILTTNDNNIIKNVDVVTLDHMSDHELVLVELNFVCPPNVPIFKTIRNFKNFNLDHFYADITLVPFEIIYDLDDVNDKLQFFTDSILSVINFHAPLKTIKITKKYSPWITDNIRLLMSLRDRARSKWRRTKTEASHNYYKTLKNYTTLACRNEKKAFFEYKIRTNGINNIWKDLKSLSIGKKDNIIPNNLRDAESLNNYYINCIPSLPTDHNIVDFYSNNLHPNADSFDFKPINEFSMQKILYSIKSNAEGYDRLTIRLLLMCCPLILPFLTHIINFCLRESVFPNNWKQALVQPIPKKSNPLEFKDLRPINVLSALSKVLEREVDSQLREYTTKYNILPEMQSGFRSLHSCETALLNITDDILRGIDQQEVTVLVLLDYSKAFDTINYEIMLSVLKYIGLSEKATKFFRNYLSNRFQRVKIDNIVSTPLEVSCGVPQGSILGPLLFTLYTSEFQNVVKNCKIHFYADDTQLYLSFSPHDIYEASAGINKDIEALVAKSRGHSLNINASKTSVLVFGPQNVRSAVSNQLQITVEGQQISPVESARNLGLTLDTDLRFKLHINNKIAAAYASLKLIYINRYYLSKKVKTILCEALVLSKFNFGDVIFSPCLDSENIRRIQVIQNSCLRLIFGIRRRQHISSKLNDIGWLNMSRRRLLHSACLFHKIITNKIPTYLNKKIQFRTDVHNLNIRFKGTLTPPLHRTEIYKRSFSYQITKIYNNIPDFLKPYPTTAFKRKFKKHLLNIQNNC